MNRLIFSFGAVTAEIPATKWLLRAILHSQIELANQLPEKRWRNPQFHIYSLYTRPQSLFEPILTQ
jgi:hypothetical protein